MTNEEVLAAKAIVPQSNNGSGLGYLEYYAGHNVYHPGFDINHGSGNQDYGSRIYPAAKGVVEYVSPSPKRINNYNGGLGLFFVVRHPELNLYTRYMHCSAVNVVPGQEVGKKPVVANVGNSGTKYAHCHFDGWRDEFNNTMKNHWRKYAYYPSNKSKRWVAERFVNPLEIIRLGIELDQEAKPVVNIVNIPLIRDKHGKIYIVRNGVYTHIKDMATLRLILGDMPGEWGQVEEIDAGLYDGMVSKI